ncbi:hypothetical protein CLV35_1855 [Motilibacter peucedani]|uniref:Uncharacterized protein n=1 Tax=Motilibacter peucedani TaxID=598650 RepID=A0A420XQ96_9ACTN|nr:hypothetical protein [Motilibacter peucedani]RKS75392.1 hypothetical protein CLV35_1855 [Motilibacter peucedani]
MLALPPEHAVAVARVVGAPATVVALGEASSAVTAAAVGAAVGIGAAASSLRRDSVAVTLWWERGMEAGPADEPDAASRLGAGIVVVERGEPAAHCAWPPEPDADEDPSVATAIAGLLGRQEQEAALRALMRRSGDPLARLAEAADLLGIAPDAVRLLTTDAPGTAVSVPAEPDRGRMRRAREAARLLSARRSSRLRRYGWAPAAVLCLVWLGSAADAAGRPSSGDVVGYLVLAAFSAAAALLALRRRR